MKKEKSAEFDELLEEALCMDVDAAEMNEKIMMRINVDNKKENTDSNN